MPAPVKGTATGVVSKSEYAAHRGFSPAYVSKLIKLGKLAAPALLADGRINVVFADQMLGDAPQPPSTTAPSTGAGANYAVERARREAAQAEIAEIELAARRSETLAKADVSRAAFEAFRALRDQLQAMPPRLAEDLAAETSPRLVEHRLRLAINAALDAAVARIEAVAGAAAAPDGGEAPDGGA